MNETDWDLYYADRARQGQGQANLAQRLAELEDRVAQLEAVISGRPAPSDADLQRFAHTLRVLTASE